MDLFEAIRLRHSYRGEFQNQRIPREDLVRIVQAGIAAPSGCNAQTTSFVIVDDPALISEIGTIVEKEFVRRAPALIVCVIQHRKVYHGMSFALEDCAAAVENMLLAITALGYASVWLDGVLRFAGRAALIGSLLGVPEDREVRVVLPVGVPSEQRHPAPKLPFETRAWFNRYGA
ncbi:MAG: nitroreductase family protein [Kiritimatiellae bacterium]|nr:nitroreductase family protein [Kiritimatiellia bacterium]